MSLLFDIIKKNQGKPTDKSSVDLQKHRLGKCNACPFFNNKTYSCGKLIVGGTVVINGEKKELCGCFLPDKVKYLNEQCPIKKW